MTDYTWNVTSTGDASTTTSWTPNGLPGASDNCIFNGGKNSTCNWDIAQVNSIQFNNAGGTNTSILNMSVAALTLNGLDVDGVSGFWKQDGGTAATTVTFTGTAPYKSTKCHIEMGTSSSIFFSETVRRATTFKINSSTGNLLIDPGIYPHLQFNTTVGPQYVAPSITGATEVHFLSIELTSTTVNFSPIGNPSANDRLKKWIGDSTLRVMSKAQLVTTASSTNTFDGGFAEWTFQAEEAGWAIPTTGTPAYNNTTFKFRKLVIDGTVDTNPWAYVTGATILNLTDLTINGGAGLKGNDSLGAAIWLTNRPTINGSFGFHPIADGIYIYKSNKIILGVADGGTGLSQVATTRIPFGHTTNQLTTSANLTYTAADFELLAGKRVKIRELSSAPTHAANYGILWVKSDNPNNLYFTDDAGNDIAITNAGSLAGGGGGGGGMTSWTLSGDSGSNQTIADGNTVDIAGGTGISTAASATDTVTVTNTGVTSNVAGAGIGVSGATGAVTVSNTGVTSNVAGANIAVSGATGAVTVSAPFPEHAAGPIPAFSAVPDEVGKVPFGWLEIVTVSGQTVFVPAWVNA